ncbi:hypothetical protein [Adonisia turfae]|uniref:Uncharacterized protein n=1 Tax=Adonisia turfae CCMR0081 TaxID=2292702 RepID=A0A6M0RMB7_9CYAN|nr:hypothetical protein [Adonisia turfae]NEZ57374.1 hypothetical protein [Adonisia turfae CCMR0081]
MNSNKQGILTILVSGIFFGSVGFWLIPENIKGMIIGAVAGAGAAGGYIHHDKRLKQFGIKQQKAQNTYQRKLDNLTASAIQTEKAIEEIILTAKTYEIKINELQDIPRERLGQPKLNSHEIDSIRTRLVKLESKVDKTSTSQNNDTSDDIDYIKQALKGLELKINSISTVSTSSDSQAIIEVGEQAISEHEETLEDKTAQKVIEWFIAKNIEVENYYEPNPTIDTLLDRLSLYLGDNYSVLKKFHRRLRSSVGKRTRFDFRDYDSRAKSIHNQYLKKLKSSDYLSLGKLVKNKETSDFIIANSYDRPDIQGFFDGGWFERFIYYKVVELFDSEGVDYQYLRNPKIAYGEKDLSELDLFFLVNGQPLLIECKAGQHYHDDIEKFNNHAKRLSLAPQNAIFVVLDIEEAEADIRTHHWNITVADQNNFLVYIKRAIKIHKYSQSSIDYKNDNIDDDFFSEEENRKVTVSDDSLETFFRKNRLNLTPESRSAVFNKLIKLIEDSDKPFSFNDITKAIRDSMKKDHNLSREKVSETLHCLRYHDLFRDNQNKPVHNTSELIYSMASLKPKTFEKKVWSSMRKKS